jgi:1,4-dihydroxy-2-naphthoate polyprenyltransferase
MAPVGKSCADAERGYTPAVVKLAAFAGVARAPFLLLPFTLVAAGAAAGAYGGAFSWSRTLLALAGLVALHMAVNTLNEWSDERTGIDRLTRRTPFSGGSGTLQAGAMSRTTALAFGLACAALGLVIGVWLALQVGRVLVPVMVAGAACVLLYTPWMTRIGIGELAAGLGLGLLPVAGSALVQGGRFGPAAWAASVPAFFMTFNLLFLNEFPDEEADRAGGRRHLVILLGRGSAARVYAVVALATPAAIVAAVVKGMLPAVCLAAVLPSLLLVGPLRWALSDPEQPVPTPALAANVVWNLTTNLVMAATLVAAILSRG